MVKGTKNGALGQFPRLEAGHKLAARIENAVQSALFAGTLRPGDFLGSEAAIAQQFGVSQMAARDALRSLQALGVIDIRAGSKGGASIASANVQRLTDSLAIQLQLMAVEWEEMIEAQSALEVRAVELAAQRATDADIATLKALLARLIDAQQDAAAFTHLALDFHETLIALAHNRVLLAQFRAMRAVLQAMYAPNTTSDIAKRVIATHRKIIKAIESRDGAGAAALMKQRLEVIRSSRPVRSKPRKTA
jgi:GntR family transcriptional regulator, transcriptional repressor for pyruvate dehydrogenase complex